MKDLNSIISLLNLVGLGGVGAFLYYLYKGLTERINSLTELANEQNKTLEAVRGRAEEFDKLSQSYKKALTDFQEMGDKLETRRQELIKELEDANTRFC
jgi:DNA repair ATPase RecN